MTNPASSTLVTRLLLTYREAILAAYGNLDRTCESDRARFRARPEGVDTIRMAQVPLESAKGL
jgi:hypothetical protein